MLFKKLGMLFKRKPKRSEWMDGLLLAESLYKDEGYTISGLYQFYHVDIGDDICAFSSGFVEYIKHLESAKERL